MLHELRHPLAPLRFGVELLHPDRPPPPRTLAAMDRQIQRLERLVVDLTGLVAGRTRGLAVRLEHVDVLELLRDVLHDAETLMQSKHHALHAHLPSSPIPVQGDGGRLRQVFSNLLLNAAKYTDPGGQITVAAACDGGQVAVSVRDTGRGIDSATLPRIFDLFVQEDSTGPGLGIGLHVVRDVVERHAGQIEVRSEGRGRESEFVVRLPIHEEDRFVSSFDREVPSR
jgi:signal transduction histidine kinase